MQGLSDTAKLELRKLKRRFQQPANISQARIAKAHELVDDREADPTDRSPLRALKKKFSRQHMRDWDHTTSLPALPPKLYNEE